MAVHVNGRLDGRMAHLPLDVVNVFALLDLQGTERVSLIPLAELETPICRLHVDQLVPSGTRRRTRTPKARHLSRARAR